MPDVYLPSREAELNTWASTFNNHIVATPASFGLTVAQATAFTALFNTWQAFYLIANNPSTRTPSAIQSKNTFKDAMIDGPGGIRQLVNIIQAFPDLTNTQRVDLGITVPDASPTPVPPPANPPVLTVVSTLGRVVKLQLRDFTDSEKRGRPEGVAGATILMFVGEEPPIDPVQWIFVLNTTRTTVDINFPPSVAPGARVWMTAFWKNPREQAGPTSVPVSARIGDDLAMAA